MTPLVLLPILLPMAAAIAMLALPASLRLRRLLALGSAAAVLLAAAALAYAVDDAGILVYHLGNWPAFAGIALVADRLAAALILLTSLLALAALLYATAGSDRLDPQFHPIFQFQIGGIALAFLTGDLFNLFVAFELLLLASYALTVAGGGRERLRAGIAYVVLNLVGSAVFLIGLALVYGTLGTLNMADAARVLRSIPEADIGLVRLAFALLALVFLLKAALLPMSFWLPHVYASAPAAAAMLFAILTKVGIYALLRLTTLILPAHVAVSELMTDWVPPLALGTMILGAIGVLAARRLSILAANIVLISSGTLLFAATAASDRALPALLFYLPQSTLAAAALFLLSGLIATARGPLGDALRAGPAIPGAQVLGGAFLLLVVTVSGLPPLPGFLGKMMLMQALPAQGLGVAYWAVLLLSGFAVALALAKGGASLFCDRGGAAQPAGNLPAEPGTLPPRRAFAALAVLVAALIGMTVLAPFHARQAAAIAAQLHQPDVYIAAVLGSDPHVTRERRP